MYRFLFMILLSSIAIVCVAQFEGEEEEESWGSSEPTLSTLAVYKQKTLAEVGQFQMGRNVHIHETLDHLANQLGRSRTNVVLKSSSTSTFTEYPILELIDRDGDKRPDQFAYSPETGGNTQDFGFLFDLNKDGKADYLVFNQGTMVTKPFKIVWTFYHMVDSDYDGKIDIWIYPDVDLDGDKFMDEGVTAWLYDINQDGKIDKGEHLGRDMRKTIDELDGVLKIKCMTQKNIEVGDAGLLKFSNNVLSDINALMD